MHTVGMVVSKRSVGQHAQPQLPAVHALYVAELVEGWHVSADALLAELGLSREALSEPGARLPLATFEQLIGQVCRLTGEPGIGFHLGLKMRISAYGQLGFAAMTAADLRGALELACRFAPTLSSVIALRLTRDEVVQAFREAELGKAETGRIQQEERAIGPQLFERQQTREQGTDREGRNEACGPPGHEQKGRASDVIRARGGTHTWCTLAQVRAGGHRS